MKIEIQIRKCMYGTAVIDVPDDIIKGAKNSRAEQLRVKKYAEKAVESGVSVTWYPEEPGDTVFSGNYSKTGI